MAMTPEVELAVKLGAAAGHASLVWQLWKAWREHELRLRLLTVTDPVGDGIDLEVVYAPRRLDQGFTASVDVLAPAEAAVVAVDRQGSAAELSAAGRTAHAPLAHRPADSRGEVGALFRVTGAAQDVRVQVDVRTRTGRKVAGLTRTVSRV